MMRKFQVYLPEETIAELAEMSASTGAATAVLIRRAIEAMIKKDDRTPEPPPARPELVDPPRPAPTAPPRPSKYNFSRCTRNGRCQRIGVPSCPECLKANAES